MESLGNSALERPIIEKEKTPKSRTRSLLAIT
jgi:hypothetical protein